MPLSMHWAYFAVFCESYVLRGIAERDAFSIVKVIYSGILLGSSHACLKVCVATS